MKCECVIKNRQPNESQRDWLKRWMCMFHWVQTDYYMEKMKQTNDPMLPFDDYPEELR